MNPDLTLREGLILIVPTLLIYVFAIWFHSFLFLLISFAYFCMFYPFFDQR